MGTKVLKKKKKSLDLEVLPAIAVGAERLLALLASKGFIEYKFPCVHERVYQRQCFYYEDVNGVKQPRVITGFVRIYTSIVGEDFRPEGEDAIRIQGIILNDPASPPIETREIQIAYNEKVLRTKNNIRKRTIFKAKRAWQAVVAAWKANAADGLVKNATTATPEAVDTGPTEKQKAYFRILTGTELVADSKKKASELIATAKENGAKPQTGAYTGPRRKRRGKFSPKQGDWKEKPVTDAQVRFAKVLVKKIDKMGYQVNTDPDTWAKHGWTAGKASEIIDKLKAKADGKIC